MALDLQDKLGQLFFIGFEGTTLSEKTRKFLQTVQPGGIVLFENNIKDKDQVKDLIKEINSCLKIRPFIAVDQEGGSVERLQKICTSLPSVWGLSKAGLKELLSAEKIIAGELLELGFNMVFGPVLDINSNPKNPVIGTRSISNDPKKVSEYGLKIINLFLKNRIIPVVKHFPGHGDLAIDSHLGLPSLNKTKSKLNNFELLPFKTAIKNKAPIVMAAHIQLPLIESNKKRPASLSKKILLGLLRKDLSFKGLILTDELNMKGVTKNFPLNIASCEALLSGADLLLYNHNEKSTLQAYAYIKGRLSKDKNVLRRIDESYKRIISTKKRFILQRMKNEPTNRRTGEPAKLLARKVVHWIKRDLFFRIITQNEPINIIFPVTPKLREEDLSAIFKKFKITKYRLLPYKINPGDEDISRILKTSKRNKKVIISYDIAVRPGQRRLIKTLLRDDPNLVVISAGLEHDLVAVPEVKNFIAAYAPNFVSLSVAFEKLLSQS